jgi:two-component system, OmpR family, sensor histidine kinase KdpD
VLGVQPARRRSLQAPEQVHLLETFASQTALAIERATLAEEAQQAQVQIETERLRNTLLSSVSHDLRTPLAAITGAASSLLEGEVALDTPTRRELLQMIYEEADRLNRLVSNLLQMTRLESGTVQLEKEWQSLEEVIGAALTRLETRLRDRPLTTHLPADLPLVPFDSALIEQVLISLLDNAIKYTPSGTPIAVSVWVEQGTVTVEVADRGPGLSPGDEKRIFEKFYRRQHTGGGGGAGLGLTICRAIVEAHGGRIWAENRPDGGAALRFTLPVQGSPPAIATELERRSDNQPA